MVVAKRERERERERETRRETERQRERQSRGRISIECPSTQTCRQDRKTERHENDDNIKQTDRVTILCSKT